MKIELEDIKVGAISFLSIYTVSVTKGVFVDPFSHISKQ